MGGVGGRGEEGVRGEGGGRQGEGDVPPLPLLQPAGGALYGTWDDHAQGATLNRNSCHKISELIFYFLFFEI